jgi:hypothetical protein
VAQASQAELCRGQARPQNHNKRFPQYQATQAGTFEKISSQLQAGQEAAQASQANGWLGCRIKTNGFWSSFFERGSCVFLKILLIPLRNVEFGEEHFGSFGKILSFSVRE